MHTRILCVKFEHCQTLSFLLHVSYFTRKMSVHVLHGFDDTLLERLYDHHFSWHRQNLLGSLNTETSRASICRARPFLFHKYIMLYIKQGISSIIETLILNCYRLSSSSLAILVFWALLPPNFSFIKYCYRNFKRVFFSLLYLINKKENRRITHSMVKLLSIFHLCMLDNICIWCDV